MNTIQHMMIITACLTSLSGCSLMGKNSEPESTTDEVINKNIELAISSIQRTQAELYQYGAINEKAVGISGGIYHDNVRIDMNWNGDAYELLSQMAKQRSFTFRSSGSKLPLPVSLKVSRAQYKDVMDSVQTQIGYRATIVVDNSSRTMTLNYNPPGVHSSSARVIRPAQTVPLPHRLAALISSAAGAPTSASGTASGTGNTFFNAAGANTSLMVEGIKVGEKCSEKGVLSRDSHGKTLSCTNGRWKKL